MLSGSSYLMFVMKKCLSLGEITMHGESTAKEAGVTNNDQLGKNNLLIRDARSEELDEVSLLIREAYMEYEHSFPPETGNCIWKTLWTYGAASAFPN
jgi:hypothetical protein